MTGIVTMAVLTVLGATTPSTPKRAKKQVVPRPDVCGPMIDTATKSMEEGVALLRQGKPEVGDGQQDAKSFEQWLVEATGVIANVRSLAKALEPTLSETDKKACKQYAASRWRVVLQPLASAKVRKKHPAALRQLGALFRNR